MWGVQALFGIGYIHHYSSMDLQKLMRCAITVCDMENYQHSMKWAGERKGHNKCSWVYDRLFNHITVYLALLQLLRCELSEALRLDTIGTKDHKHIPLLCQTNLRFQSNKQIRLNRTKFMWLAISGALGAHSQNAKCEKYVSEDINILVFLQRFYFMSMLFGWYPRQSTSTWCVHMLRIYFPLQKKKYKEWRVAGL